MAIVCGTDFSEQASRAASTAALLAARSKLPLHLVHALSISTDDSCAPAQAVRDWATTHLQREADRLRAIAGGVEIHVVAGLPDEALLDIASQVSATLIVVGSTGRRHGRATLGGHADRIAQRSHAPILVVRDAGPFERWARESKPLRVVLGADATMSSEAAMRWINGLRAFGPCDVIAIHVYWPPEQFQRLGLGGVRNYVDPDPEVTKTLEREFSERLARVPGSGPVGYRFEPHLGRVADCLATLAAEENADLVVVGSHDRGAVERLWEGSVSRGVLRCASSSVACIPTPIAAQNRTTPNVRSVLVATDFSSVGDAAIPLAYAIAKQGGTIHLVHVAKVPTEPIAPHDIFSEASLRTQSVDALRRQLVEKIPSDATELGKSTHVHVLEAHDPARAICQAAERLGVDVVCLGTHGHSGIVKALLGSVAQDVVSKSKRPVLLARAPLD